MDIALSALDVFCHPSCANIVNRRCISLIKVGKLKVWTNTITKVKLAYLSSGRQNYQLPELKVCQKAKIDASVYIMEIISTPGMKAFMTVRGEKITLLRCFSRK
ncbi:hypothetical protein MAR_013433 [Mya arenaria]|uniref:Uncharacterized protein n=1 Tax=Mya arenaria TaxID=6604 RepID=A0ABY7G2V1_MYAAR|nr:hypothetical protein MAR_013433 [Mya arenaria]